MIISVVAVKIWYLKNVRFLLGQPVVDDVTAGMLIDYSMANLLSPFSVVKLAFLHNVFTHD